MATPFFSLFPDQLSALPAPSSVADTDVVYAVVGGVGVKATRAQLLTAATPGANSAGIAIALIGSDATGGNTNGGDVLLKPGAKAGAGADGKAIVRQPGGAAGTNETQLSQSATQLLVESKGGFIEVHTSDMLSGRSVKISGVLGGGVPTLNAIGASRLCVDAILCAAGSSTGWSVDNGGNIQPSTSTWMVSWNSDTGLTRAAAKVVELNNRTAGGAGATLRSVPLTPTTLSADQNDYNPGVARRYRLATNGAGARTITGLSIAQVDGQEFSVVNVGTDTITLSHQNAASAAANRFICTGAADIVLSIDQEVLVWYDSTTARFRARKV